MRGPGAAPERVIAVSPSSAAAWYGVAPAALTCTAAASPKKAAIRRLQSLHSSLAMAARLSASAGGRRPPFVLPGPCGRRRVSRRAVGPQTLEVSEACLG